VNPEPPAPALATLLSKLVDGLITPAETAKLEDILRQNPAARAHYRAYVSNHFDLSDSLPGLEAPRNSGGLRRSSVLLAIAASLALIAGIAFMASRPDSNTSVTSQDTATDVIAQAPVLAVTAVTEDVRWSLKMPPKPGIELAAGRMELTAGTLALTLSGGQLVTLAAPSDFELIDETEVYLHRGSASLRIVGSAGPYGIRVPRGKVLDLGTEFSVKVAPDGTADVWVFAGRALVSRSDGASPREEYPLSAGQSLRIGETLMPSPAAPGDFVRPLLEADDPAAPPSNVIAHFSAEFPASNLGSGQPFDGSETPADGWSYLWNPTGVLGDAANYRPLAPNTINTFPSANGGGIFPMFTNFGNIAFNSEGQLDFRFGRVSRTSIHPGKSAPGKDYRAIIAYTVQAGEAGEIRLANSSLAKYRVDGTPANGVDLDVYVNDTPVTELRKSGFQSLTATRFDGSLGTLAAGDTIYVMLGNNGDEVLDGYGAYDAFDACVIDFQLVKAP